MRRRLVAHDLHRKLPCPRLVLRRALLPLSLQRQAPAHLLDCLPLPLLLHLHPVPCSLLDLRLLRLDGEHHIRSPDLDTLGADDPLLFGPLAVAAPLLLLLLLFRNIHSFPLLLLLLLVLFRNIHSFHLLNFHLANRDLQRD